MEPLTEEVYSELEISKRYTVEYAVVGRSWSKVYLKGFNERGYNSALFNYEWNGEPADIIDRVSDALFRISRIINPYDALHPSIHVYCYEPLSKEALDKIVVEYEKTPMMIYPTNSIEELKNIIMKCLD